MLLARGCRPYRTRDIRFRRRPTPCFEDAVTLLRRNELSGPDGAQQYPLRRALERHFGVVLAFVIAWVMLAVELRWREGCWRPAARPDLRALLIGSLTVGVAYALVIHAMRVLPAAYAVTLANGGILLMVVLGVVWLGEHQGWRRRLAGAATSAVGMAIVGIVAHGT